MRRKINSRSFSARRNRFSEFNDKDEEMTIEEKNILNMTRKNTTFNSHAPNLSVDEPKPVRLGCNENKSSAPLITVRPFVRDSNPGKVHVVSPMRNGEVVTSFSSDPPRVGVDKNETTGDVSTTTSLSTVDGGRKEEEEVGQGEEKTAKILTEEKSTTLPENNSSEESGVSDDHSSSEGEMANEEVNSFSDTLSDENEAQNEVSDNFEKRATFSNSLSSDVSNTRGHISVASRDELSTKLPTELTINFEAAPSLSSVSDDGEASNEHSSSSSSTSGDEETKFEKNKCVEEEEVHHQHGRDFFHANARLSFLHSTIQFEDSADSGLSKDDQSSSCSSYNSHSEEISEPTSTETAKPKVKITRKSPYVVGPYASTAILKGTPKPSVNIRKPPLPKEKPKVPMKPEKFLQSRVGPSPPPRQSSFRKTVASNEVTISDESKIQLFCNSESQKASLPEAAFECYSAVSDVQNALIIDVTGSGPAQPESPQQTSQEQQQQPQQELDVVTVTGSNAIDPDEVSTTAIQQQKDFSTKNKEALEAIRRSLSDKLAERVMFVEARSEKKVEVKEKEPQRVEEVEKESKKVDQDEDVVVSGKRPVEKTISNTSSNFEMNRSAIANALEFNRIARPSTKRQAPKPPPTVVTEISLDEPDSAPVTPVATAAVAAESVTAEEVVLDEAPTKDLPPEPLPIPTPPPPPPGPLLPKSVLSSTTNGGRHSSMKSADSSSPKNREVKNRVQFSPETTTVTLPPTEDRNLLPISYNRWISRGPADVIESSFTGQPINVTRPPPLVPVVQSSSHPKRPVPVTYAPMPQVDDEVRRWTEKKQKQRSKSLPRGSEIDEMMGSSKQTKSGSKLFPPISVPTVATASNVRRQSRVELYEAERKQIQQQLQQQHRKGKFSLKKFFKLNLVSNPYGIQFAPTTNESPKSPNTSQPFMDKEHEREILEREKNRLRPEIIHPIDLQSAGVEVVCITPRGQQQQHFEKNQQRPNSSNKSGSASACKSLTAAKSKLDYVDSKDSGHETSSIQTENSENSSTTSSSGATPSPTLHKSFHQPVRRIKCSPVYVGGLD